MKALSIKQKDFLYRTCVFGKLRVIAKPCYDALIAIILIVERIRDYCAYKDNGDVSDLTIIIKTFEREQSLTRLVNSIRRHYPKIAVIVVNDSRQPKKIAGVMNLIMPYDSGISAGRNLALEKVETMYFMILDDDFVFSRRQKLSLLVDEMRRYPDIDILGGRCIDLPFFIIHSFQNLSIQSTARSKILKGTKMGKNVVVDKVQNYFIAKTDSVRKVRWNNQLKTLEHTEFFTRAKGKLVTAYRDDMLVLHAKTPFDIAYLIKRFR